MWRRWECKLPKMPIREASASLPAECPSLGHGLIQDRPVRTKAISVLGLFLEQGDGRRGSPPLAILAPFNLVRHRYHSMVVPAPPRDEVCLTIQSVATMPQGYGVVIMSCSQRQVPQLLIRRCAGTRQVSAARRDFFMVPLLKSLFYLTIEDTGADSSVLGGEGESWGGIAYSIEGIYPPRFGSPPSHRSALPRPLRLPGFCSSSGPWASLHSPSVSIVRH